jgi:hypothetical protein
MPERGVTAHPEASGAVFRTAGTMIAALYGQLIPHAWRDPASEHDAYQLFHQRSVAMGWLDDRSAGGDAAGAEPRATGLWAMNDAGWQQSLAGAGTDLVAWFQVETSAVAADRPLPAQPFLRCAGDVMATAGMLDLTGLQVLLPIHGLDAGLRPAYAPVPSLLTVDWFAERDPRARTPVSVTLDSGQDPSVTDHELRLVELLRGLDQDVFVFEAHADTSPGVSDPPWDNTFWNGPSRHRATLRGNLVEWSPDALGWLAGLLADVSGASGIGSPLVVTLTKSTR